MFSCPQLLEGFRLDKYCRVIALLIAVTLITCHKDRPGVESAQQVIVLRRTAVYGRPLVS